MIGAALRLGLRFLLAGAVVAAVIALEDASRGIRQSLGHAGWSAVAALCAWQVIPISLCSLAWWRLQVGHRRSLRLFLIGRWIRDAVDTLVAIVPFSGEFAVAGLFSRFGIATRRSAALMVADLTCEVGSQIVFSMAGIFLWVMLAPSGPVLRWSLIGTAVGLPAIGGFVLAQRLGLTRLIDWLSARLSPAGWRRSSIGGAIHRRLGIIYSRRSHVVCGLLLHLAAWTASAGEAYLALLFLDRPLAPIAVVAMESVIFAIRSATFLVPAGLGFQEGGYVLVGGLLGLPPEVALSLSLLKRGRELSLGLPALLLWQAAQFPAMQRLLYPVMAAKTEGKRSGKRSTWSMTE